MDGILNGNAGELCVEGQIHSAHFLLALRLAGI
jgi:hypothetical protein